MAKKDKNSLLNIHYSRTMTSDNLSKAANYVGKYVLKGLGAFGKIMTAPFVQQGPTSATIYKSKELLAKERTIENKSEELLGKAMTWASPLNYGAALATGNGLNARKGEEEVASWSPAWLALGRAAELYVGPKAVKGVGKGVGKGVKSAPKTVVNAAAKAGNKTAKKAVVARKINEAVKKGVNKEILLDLLAKDLTGTTSQVKIKELYPEFEDAMNNSSYVFGRQSYQPTGSRKWKTLIKYKDAPAENYMSLFKYPLLIKNGLLTTNRPIWLNKNRPYFGTPSRSNYSNSANYTYVVDAKKFTPELNLQRDIGSAHYEYPGTDALPIEATKRILFDPILGQYTSTRFVDTPKLTGLPSTSLAFFERKPSKISKAERAGVPKGERFKNKKHYTGIGRNYRGTIFGEENIPKDIEYVEPITSGKKFGESDYSFENRKYATKQYLKELNNRDSGIFSDKGVESIKKYISLLPDDLNPNFINTNGLLSFYIRDFRLYLNDLGYRAGDLTDTEIAKLLTNLYDILSKTLTGKLKGKVVFHSGPNFFDLFDFAHTGETMGNMGYLGPGNYFSTKPSVYGGKGNYTTQDLIGQYRYPRRLPYLINNIKSTPVSGELKRAKIIPEYTSPPRETYGDTSAKNNYILLVILPLVKSTKVRDMAVLDDISVSPHSLYTNGVQTEFMVPRNTGIKSLYPHPSLFIEDANGKITLNRNWDDIRVNYKQGGKMNILKFLKNGGQVRKMLTAAGGPLRIKFTPEEIALFESQATRVPGMNNSGGNRYRKEGVLALLYLKQEAKRKEEEIKSRMEMRPTLKRRATFSEKLRGKKDEYVPTTQIVGMSGADPLLSFYVGGVGLNGIGALAKTGLWNIAKYAPTTLLGNWGRGYFIGNTFKSSFNGSVPTLTSLATSLLYLPVELNETGLSSLKFFERPTLSNAQELAGATRWERNFRPQWHVANYPGYLLKGLMRGSLLEKQLSKNGTININLLNAYFNKASQLEKEIANKVLAEKFAGLKTIDYNLFKKAVLDELIGSYNRVPLIKYADYGMDRIGLAWDRRLRYELLIKDKPEILQYWEYNPNTLLFTVKSGPNKGLVADPELFYGDYFKSILPGLNTFTFESPRISVGNNKHYDTTTLGHSRTYTTPDEPNILHVMESLSDWGQSHVKMIPSVLAHQIAIENALKSGNINAFHSFTNRFSSLLADKLSKYERMALENINKEIESGQPSGFLTIEDLWNKKYEILKKAGNRSNIGVLGLHLHDNYLQRQLQENLRYAAENGYTKMRYPTSETAAKIEGYAKQNLYKNSEGKIVTSREALQHSDPNIINDLREDLAELASNLRRQGILPSTNQLWIKMNTQLKELESPKLKEGFLDIGLDYPLEHQTILKKYADFPKLFLKLYKGQNVRTVTDTKGNTWYEVDVPKGYLSREWQFKQGGKMNKLIKMLLGGLFKLTDYIKAIENPDSIGWNGRVWAAPTLKGYDKNQRGFGIDVNTNKEARALTEGRPGRWLTDREANTLMNNHINYITKVANKHIKGFSKLSPKRQAALLGMLYRGDSVNKSGINIYEPNDHKFFKSISNYYRSKGLNTRADNSDKFFNISSKLKMGGLLEFLKNGSGIHIKKKNRGKFTEYCGGKVTQECIRKAKASGNPTLVKRATFADNARHFKHLLGGNIIFPNDSNPNAFGGVFENVLLGRLRDLELQYYRKKLKEQQALIDLLLEQLKSDVISNILGTAVNTGLNYLLKSKQEKAT